MVPVRPPGAAPSGRSAVELLRIGLGVIWSLNLLYILVPANGFFASFSDTASSFGPTTPGGAGFADAVAQQPLLFSSIIAVTTAYLAVAFLTGTTTRLACGVGAAFNAVLLLTQFGALVTVGATDVGPMPLYLLLYLGLFLGRAGESVSLGAWLRRGALARAGPASVRKARWAPSPAIDSVPAGPVPAPQN